MTPHGHTRACCEVVRIHFPCLFFFTYPVHDCDASHNFFHCKQISLTKKSMSVPNDDLSAVELESTVIQPGERLHDDCDVACDANTEINEGDSRI